MLETGPIKFAIAQQYHRHPRRDQLVHVRDQGDVQVFGKVQRFPEGDKTQ
jgi:hypothetical protein